MPSGRGCRRSGLWALAVATPGGTATSTSGFTVTLALMVTVPHAGAAAWPSGSTQSLGWTVSTAVDSGEFGVWLVDASDGTKWYGAGFYGTEAGTTRYTPSFSTLGIPTGSYRVVVYYRTDPGQRVWSANAESPGAAQITD